MSLPAYPTHLPGVASLADLTLDPRRRAATVDNSLALALRLRQTARQWTARATWGAFTAAQAAQWRAWWHHTLRQGGSLFELRLPMPGGPAVMVCRMAGPPRFEHLPGGFFRVEAPLQIRTPPRGAELLDCAGRPLQDAAGRPLQTHRLPVPGEAVRDTSGLPLQDTAGLPLAA